MGMAERTYKKQPKEKHHHHDELLGPAFSAGLVLHRVTKEDDHDPSNDRPPGIWPIPPNTLPTIVLDPSSGAPHRDTRLTF